MHDKACRCRASTRARPRRCVLAITVPIAAPRVPKAGIGPAPLMNTTFKQKLSTVIASPSRSGVRASPAARSAPPSMKNISSPMLPMNIVRRNGSASARTAGVALTSVSSVGDSDVPERRQDGERQHQRGEERLVDRAVDAIFVVGAGEARDEHAHAGEQRADEDDDDEENLPADADGRIAGVADVVADQRVIDDALEAADRVLQDRRPGELPDRRHDRPIDDRAIEALAPWRTGSAQTPRPPPPNREGQRRQRPHPATPGFLEPRCRDHSALGAGDLAISSQLSAFSITSLPVASARAACRY